MSTRSGFGQYTHSSKSELVLQKLIRNRHTAAIDKAERREAKAKKAKGPKIKPIKQQRAEKKILGDKLSEAGWDDPKNLNRRQAAGKKFREKYAADKAAKEQHRVASIRRTSEKQRIAGLLHKPNK